MKRYNPEDEGRAPWRWLAAAPSSTYPPAVSTPRAPTPLPAAAAPNDQPPPTEPPDKTAQPPTVVATSAPLPSFSQRLARGDAVLLYLRGIPNPEDINDMVDSLGNVTLPLIGKVRVEGLTTAEAEATIEKLYIDGDIYKSIDVIMVAKEGEYFVRGEVKREGKYPVRGELTLLQAVAEAGGYTDFAKDTEIKVIRGDHDMTYNARRIETRRDSDPVIKAGDIVIVPRRRW